MSSPTRQEVRESVLIDGFPPGTRNLLDVDNQQSNVYKEFDSIAGAIKGNGFDLVEQFRVESIAYQATSAANGLLPDFEAALALSASKTALLGTDAARQAQVTSRFRESGASTIPNISAALAAVCGPANGAFTILEHSRSALTTANTRTINAGDVTINALGATTIPFTLHDNAPASNYGTSLNLSITSGHYDALSYTLVAPDSTTKQWAAQGAGSVTAQSTWLWGPEFSGAQIEGTWNLVIVNVNAATSTLKAGSTIFVEGIGRDVAGAEGDAANIFEWAVLIDESLITPSTYDRELCRTIVSRWNPAHCRGYLDVKATNGSTYGVFDDANSTFDGCLFAT